MLCVYLSNKKQPFRRLSELILVSLTYTGSSLLYRLFFVKFYFRSLHTNVLGLKQIIRWWWRMTILWILAAFWIYCSILNTIMLLSNALTFSKKNQSTSWQHRNHFSFLYIYTDRHSGKITFTLHLARAVHGDNDRNWN